MHPGGGWWRSDHSTTRPLDGVSDFDRERILGKREAAFMDYDHLIMRQPRGLEVLHCRLLLCNL